MKLKKILTVILTFILILTFTACSKTKIKSGKPVIAVSIIPQSTFVKEVCGDKFEIITMIPSGASPETYEPTPKDIAGLEIADIYFSIGVPAEENILPSVSDKTEISELHTAAAKVYPDIYDGHGRDPHIWLSPKRVIVMINEICEILSEFDPENKDFYKRNTENYIKKLTALDSEVNTLLEDKAAREILVFHPAFGYFAEDYKLKMHSLEEHGKEATAKHMAEMADLAKENNIKVIFYQEEASSRQAESFADEIGGKAVKLTPLAADYTENIKKMAEAISEAIN